MTTLTAGTRASRPEQQAGTARIALLGCGNVGREVARAIPEQIHSFARRGLPWPEIVSILVRDPERDRGLDPALFTNRLDQVLAARPDVVIEVLGGVMPAAEFAEAVVTRGVPLITANKSLIARHGARLRDLAARHGCAIACEAAVGAAIPLLAALRQLAGDDVRSIRAAASGTCNFILSTMERTGGDLPTALAAAQRLGLCEPDPSHDLSGRDAAEKIAILAAELGFTGLQPDGFEVRGIGAVTRRDLLAAKSLGCVLRLVAELDLTAGPPWLRVGPVLVAREHPLARVSGAQNTFVIETARGGTLVLTGEGAGPQPTTSAVLGDLVGVLESIRTESEPPDAAATPHGRPPNGRDARGPARRHLLRMETARPLPRPADLLDQLRLRGVTPRSVHVAHRRIEIVTDAVPGATASDAGDRLADLAGSSALIAPMIAR
jgi:homoserine dehydrogenase